MSIKTNNMSDMVTLTSVTDYFYDWSLFYKCCRLKLEYKYAKKENIEGWSII